MNRIVILGVPIDACTQRDVLEKMAAFFRSATQHHIATPNPEMLVEAQKNEEFKRVLNNTDLNIPDGVGLLWAAKKQGTPLPERITGIDMLQNLCSGEARVSPPERVFLLGAKEGVAEKAAGILTKKNPHLQIVGTHAGSPREEDEEEMTRVINEASPTLLFVAYGAPKQDLWIARNLSKMPSVKVAMGVGGAFDFIAGVQKRAPKWMQKAGLEWLWRLMREPRRAKRIWNAVVVFPLLVLKSK